MKLIQDYLLNQKQRTKVGSSYNSWENIISGIPQGSILRPRFFNIFLCDLFLEHEECCFTNESSSNADVTTPHVVANNTEEVTERESYQCNSETLYSVCQ